MCSVMRGLVNSRWNGSISLCAAACLTCQPGDNFIHVTCRRIKNPDKCQAVSLSRRFTRAASKSSPLTYDIWFSCRLFRRFLCHWSPLNLTFRAASAQLTTQNRKIRFQIETCTTGIPLKYSRKRVSAAARFLAAAVQLVADEVQHRLFVLSCWCLAYPPHHLTLWPA